MKNTPLFRCFMLFLGFHTFVVLIFILSLFGVFILLPLVGAYNAFVLGFLGEQVINSPAKAMMLGYLVFAVCALGAAGIIRVVRKNSGWMSPMILLAVTLTCMILASLARHTTTVNIPEKIHLEVIPQATAIPEIDWLSMALKAQYHKVGELPPSIPGRNAVISFSKIRPEIELLSGNSNSYDTMLYCNLSPGIWQALKKAGGSEKYPLVWSSMQNSSGNRIVVSVDLQSGFFHDELIPEERFQQRLLQIQTRIRTLDSEFDITKAVE